MTETAETFIIDFVARGGSPDEWKVVLVEQGPWRVPATQQLLGLQNRLYDSIDAVLDGQVAETFPETKGGKITVQLDCYDLPDQEVREFFSRFSAGVFQIPDYRNALKNSQYAQSISFELNMDSVDARRR